MSSSPASEQHARWIARVRLGVTTELGADRVDYLIGEGAAMSGRNLLTLVDSTLNSIPAIVADRDESE